LEKTQANTSLNYYSLLAAAKKVYATQETPKQRNIGTNAAYAFLRR
jgi:hypothetical protein